VRFHAVHVPKAGYSEDEYEDAVAADASSGRLAMADGATESSFSRQWAEELTSAFVTRPPKSGRKRHIRSWLRELCSQWGSRMTFDGMAWYAQEKGKLGAFATLLAVTLNLQARRWYAWAVGDCNLFKYDDTLGDITRFFPLKEASQFGVSPPLLCSVARRNESAFRGLQRTWGKFNDATTLLVASDALAHWILMDLESEGERWRRLLDRQSEAFSSLVEELRNERLMRNDDATLVLVTFDGVAGSVEGRW